MHLLAVKPPCVWIQVLISVHCCFCLCQAGRVERVWDDAGKALSLALRSVSAQTFSRGFWLLSVFFPSLSFCTIVFCEGGGEPGAVCALQMKLHQHGRNVLPTASGLHLVPWMSCVKLCASWEYVFGLSVTGMDSWKVGKKKVCILLAVWG